MQTSDRSAVAGVLLRALEALAWTVFFAFAAVDFWFPRVLKKKWLEAQAQRGKGEGGRMKDEGGKA